MKHEENVTYEFIAADDPNDQAWNIRILDGMFNETVIQYGAIEMRGDEEDAMLSFNFHVIESPDPETDDLDERIRAQCAGLRRFLRDRYARHRCHARRTGYYRRQGPHETRRRTRWP